MPRVPSPESRVPSPEPRVPNPTVEGCLVSTEGVSDSDLIGRARDGDAVAFGALVDRYRTPVFRAALAALGSREDAEEVAQDAFVAAYRALPGFRGDASFKTWLVSIAWRKALTRRKSVRTLMRRFVAPPADAEWQVPDTGRSQEQAVMDEDLHRQLKHLIAALAPKLRDALLLAASRDYTMDEIARLLGLPTGTVKWRIAEARRQLKAGLAQVGYGHV
jgi:RNA polymerase sigma-70 factor, ECF subfamily